MEREICTVAANRPEDTMCRWMQKPLLSDLAAAKLPERQRGAGFGCLVRNGGGQVG